MRIRTQGVLLVACAAAATLSACGSRAEEVPEGVAPWALAPADTQWVTIEGIEFPEGMDTADPVILEAYLFAAQHPEVLQHMPCYCGCEADPFHHESNYDCFVDIIDRSGTVPRVSPDGMGFS
jgi:hypothetical protein